ncbi:TIGR00730 family Rossman fold protein [Candidatus Dependentiae bacterium]|nr:TIGR00730 family Rossman fold protein [Candidatus Dependentiae bacterium]
MQFFKRLKMLFGMMGHFLVVFLNLIYGIWKISKLNPPIVTIFGGTHLAQNSKYMHEAHNLAGNLISNHISVLTGGGPGIMEAASCGAIHKLDGIGGAQTIGITVKGLEENIVNPCVKDYIVTDHFFVRKWLLVNYSSGFVVFPGGYGTLDELAEILTLMQTKQVKQAPVILFGKEYWMNFLQWMEFSVLKNGLITQEHFKFITITDDINEALNIIKKACDKQLITNKVR